jgi:uncharacterized protein
MKLRRCKFIIVAVIVVVVVGLLASWMVGGALVAPSKRKAGKLPQAIVAETIKFHSESGAEIVGWFVPVENSNAPVVILMHGVRGCRGDMLGRARWLHKLGYATLMFDFQAHGESSGTNITFGYLESRDAQAAVKFVRGRCPNSKIAALGVSMGGAACLLADPPLQVDAMVLESVYPNIVQATEDRIVMRLGSIGKILTPLLTSQLTLRLGISAEQLRPIDGAAKIKVPKFFLAGTKDQQTTIEEAKSLFAAAAEPKQFWAVEGAGHVNLNAFDRSEYEQRVLSFLKQTLSSEK